MKVLSIDPGERVGWASADVTLPSEAGRFVGPAVHDVKSGVMPLKDFALWLAEDIGRIDLVVLESWKLFPQSAKTMIGSDMPTSQLIGIIKHLVWTNHHVEFVMQDPNLKKTANKTMPDWLKAHMDTTTEEHSRDALRHLWHWFWTNHA